MIKNDRQGLLLEREDNNVAETKKALFGGRRGGALRAGRQYKPQIIIRDIVQALPANGEPIDLKRLMERTGPKKYSRHVLKGALLGLKELEGKLVRVFVAGNRIFVSLQPLETRFVVPRINEPEMVKSGTEQTLD